MSTMVVLVTGKKVIDDIGVDGVIVRLGYSGVEDKELLIRPRIESFRHSYGVYLYMPKMKQMLRMMPNRLLNLKKYIR